MELLYPRTKERKDRIEKSLKTPVNSALPLPGDNVSYFSPYWRDEDIVINLLAEKYGDTLLSCSDIENEENEIFLLGMENCIRRKEENSYLKKAFDTLSKKSIDDVIALHLLGKDRRDDGVNKQKFVALTKDDCVVWSEKLTTVEHFDYENLLFANGTVFSSTKLCEGPNLLNDDDSSSLDERFLNFAREYQLLRCNDTDEFQSIVPFGKIKNKEAEELLKFLVKVVKFSESVTVTKLLHLAALFKEKGVVSSCFIDCLRKGIPKDKNVASDYRTVAKKLSGKETLSLAVEILWLMVDKDFEFSKFAKCEFYKKLCSDVGAVFVDNYCQYLHYVDLSNKWKMEGLVPNYFIKDGIPWLRFDLEDFLNTECYNNVVNCEIFRKGVKSYGK